MTAHPFPRLFEPLAVGPLTMWNRVAMCPMTTAFPEADGSVTERLISFLEARARGGVALVLTEGAVVHPLARGWVGHLAAYDDRYLPGLARLAAAIKRHGALAFLQLMHTGRRTVSSVIGEQPVAPSAIAAPGRSWEVPRAMSPSEVDEHIDAFVTTIARAKRAGFDGVELHGGHGYLIHQFLSPLSNQRDDEYGGDRLRRTRFATEIIRRAHQLVGDDFPIGCRVSMHEFEPGGIAVEDTQEVVGILERAGAAYIDGSAGISSLTKELRWTTGMGEATLAEYAVEVKPHLTIPLMMVGRILRPQTAERVLREGIADIAGVGRALIADPDWVRKAAEGGDIQLCIGCNACQMRPEHRRSGCPVNVWVGHEFEYRVRPTTQPRRVLVVNSGLGGLECALAAARRGHAVRIANIGLPFGGLFGLRARVPGNEEVAEALDPFHRRVEAAAIPVADLASLAQAIAWAEPDVVVNATPGRPVSIPTRWPAFQAQDVMTGAVNSATLGRRVAVIGNGFAAAETALFVASRGHSVTVLASAERLARDTHPQLAYRVNERFATFGGRVATSIAYADLTPPRGAVATLTASSPAEKDFNSAVLALGWEAGDQPLGDGTGDYRYVGDAYNPWETRFVTERGIELGLAL